MYRNNKTLINPNNLKRGIKYYHIDHKFSLKQAYLMGLPIYFHLLFLLNFLSRFFSILIITSGLISVGRKFLTTPFTDLLL